MDGAKEYHVSIKLSHLRKDSRLVRARPGTFEWRYNRDDDSLTALYDAGSQFAILWERAGTASASSPDWKASGGGGAWKGLPDGRMDAMDKIRSARGDIGKWGTARLVDYCVMGSTIADIAAKWDVDERAMGHTLMMDLKACAMHFRLL